MNRTVIRAGMLLALLVPLVSFSPGCSSTDDSLPEVTIFDAGLRNDANHPGLDAADNPDTATADDASPSDDGGTAPDGPLPKTCATYPGTPESIVGFVNATRTLTCDKIYQISGTVILNAGVTLTIEAGTTILMATDGSLIVDRGAKLVAVGTRDQPIVFTSSKIPGTRAPGDWGAVVLVGKAPGNWGKDSNGIVYTEHVPDANDWPGGFPLIAGGTEFGDGSGTLKYVRMEYGGRVQNSNGFSDHEMLGLYGVGTGTTLDYVDLRQSSYGCLFAQGGAFDARHVICQWGGNGGFDFTRGNRSRMQFAINLESPAKSAEGIGLKGPSDGNLLTPLTDPTIYNVTTCGPNQQTNVAFKDPYGIFLKRAPAGRIYNTIAIGYRSGLAMRTGAATTEVRSSILFGNADPAQSGVDTNIGMPGQDEIDLVPWFTKEPWKNATTDPGLPGCFDAVTMSMAPAKSITTNAATPPGDGFFDPTATYIGAFKDKNDTWATGAWVVWSDK